MGQPFRPKHSGRDWSSLAIFVIVIIGCAIVLAVNR